MIKCTEKDTDREAINHTADKDWLETNWVQEMKYGMPKERRTPTLQHVNYEVQPENQNLNFDDIAKKLIAEIKVNGLKWANGYTKQLVNNSVNNVD